MGGIINKDYMGTIVDPLNSNESQEELNEQLLIKYDMDDLYQSISKRIGNENLTFLLKDVDIQDLEYWKGILLKLAKNYHLNYCKVYIYETESTKPIIDEIIKTIKYIKIRLINLIEIGDLKKDIQYEEFIRFLNSDEECPELFKLCVKFIELSLFDKFKNVLYIESLESPIL